MKLFRVRMRSKESGKQFTFHARGETATQAIDRIFEFFPTLSRERLHTENATEIDGGENVQDAD